MATIGDRNV